MYKEGKEDAGGMTSSPLERAIYGLNQVRPAGLTAASPQQMQREIDLYWMTICLLLTRHSTSKRGQMTALLLSPDAPLNLIMRLQTPSSSSTEKEEEQPFRLGSWVRWANNLPLLPATDATVQQQQTSRQSEKVGEVHAEACVIAQAAADGVAIAGWTLYITFPPCTSCFSTLLMSRLRRCVYRKTLTIPYAPLAATAHHLSLVSIHQGSSEEQKACEAKMKEWARRAWAICNDCEDSAIDNIT